MSKPPGHGFPDQGADTGEGEEEEGEHLRRAELQGRFREERRDEHDGQHPERSRR